MEKPNHSYAYYYPSDLGSSEFEWTIFVEKLPDNGDWFLSFYPVGNLNNRQTGLYAGLQIIAGKAKVIFSVWDSLEARSGNGFKIGDTNENGPGKKIIGDYNWAMKENCQFKLTIKNNLISLYIGNDRIGEHTVPSEWKLNPERISLFVERLIDETEPRPLSIDFSEFLPKPKKLTGPKGDSDNPLGLNVSAFTDKNKIIFKSPDS